jgi:hypothetical protein
MYGGAAFERGLAIGEDTMQRALRDAGLGAAGRVRA